MATGQQSHLYLKRIRGVWWLLHCAEYLSSKFQPCTSCDERWQMLKACNHVAQSLKSIGERQTPHSSPGGAATSTQACSLGVLDAMKMAARTQSTRMSLRIRRISLPSSERLVTWRLTSIDSDFGARHLTYVIAVGTTCLYQY